MAWPEMMRLHQVAPLTDLKFLGPPTPEIRDWLERASPTVRVHCGNQLAAGFRR